MVRITSLIVAVAWFASYTNRDAAVVSPELNAAVQSRDSCPSWVSPACRRAAVPASGGGGDESAACASAPSWLQASFTCSGVPAPESRWFASLLSACRPARCAALHAWRSLDRAPPPLAGVVVVAPLTLTPQVPGTQGLTGAWPGLARPAAPWLAFPWLV